jgi:hypothetical protein
MITFMFITSIMPISHPRPPLPLPSPITTTTTPTAAAESNWLPVSVEKVDRSLDLVLVLMKGLTVAEYICSFKKA